MLVMVGNPSRNLKAYYGPEHAAVHPQLLDDKLDSVKSLTLIQDSFGAISIQAEPLLDVTSTIYNTRKRTKTKEKKKVWFPN
jgi:hypothetical protein